MTPEAQRIAIAEACGWSGPFEQRLYMSPDSDEFDYAALSGNNPKSGRAEPLPDYLNDLNAMHEAENTLPVPQRKFYCDWLMYGEINPAKETPWGKWQTINATAAQRAEAFLRTIGKWEDETITPPRTGKGRK